MSAIDGKGTANKPRFLGAAFLASSKTTAAAAAAAAEWTKLATVSLPAAYIALGKHCASRTDLRHLFPERYAALDRVRAEIEEATRALSGNSKATTFAEKAKEIARKGVTLAASQAQKVRYQKALYDLGANAYAAKDEANAPLELCERISTISERIALLEKQRTQKALVNAQPMKTEGHDNTAAKKTAKTGTLGLLSSILFSPVVVKASAIIFAPLGLLLIWLHPSWPKTRRVLWSGIAVVCFFGLAYIGMLQVEATKGMVAAGDELWEQRKWAEAAEQYHLALPTIKRLPKDEQAAFYVRLIDYESTRGQEAIADRLVAQVVSAGIQIPAEFDRVRVLVENHKRTVAAQAEARKLAAKEEQERKKREALAKAKANDDTPSSKTAAQMRKEERELEDWSRKNPDRARESDRRGRERAAEDRRKGKYMQELGKPSWDPTRDPSKYR
jgi:hypothetical protein